MGRKALYMPKEILNVKTKVKIISELGLYIEGFMGRTVKIFFWSVWFCVSNVFYNKKINSSALRG